MKMDRASMIDCRVSSEMSKESYKASRFKCEP